MIKPTVGRKVWYRPSRQDLTGPVPMSMQGNPDYNPQPLDATVLAVWGDRCINIQVLDILGKPFTKTSVMLVQEGDPTPKTVDDKEAYGYAEWMPYQLGQPARDAALAQLAPIGSPMAVTMAADGRTLNIPLPDTDGAKVSLNLTLNDEQLAVLNRATVPAADTSGLPG